MNASWAKSMAAVTNSSGNMIRSCRRHLRAYVDEGFFDDVGSFMNEFVVVVVDGGAFLGRLILALCTTEKPPLPSKEASLMVDRGTRGTCDMSDPHAVADFCNSSSHCFNRSTTQASCVDMMNHQQVKKYIVGCR